jgi:Flp pilus assembly pilin Flp
MQKIWVPFKCFWKKEEGMETAELAVVAALVIAVTIAVWTALGNAITTGIQALTAYIQ